jgi:hypothetical protein
VRALVIEKQGSKTWCGADCLFHSERAIEPARLGSGGQLVVITRVTPRAAKNRASCDQRKIAARGKLHTELHACTTIVPSCILDYSAICTSYLLLYIIICHRSAIPVPVPRFDQGEREQEQGTCGTWDVRICRIRSEQAGCELITDASLITYHSRVYSTRNSG